MCTHVHKAQPRRGCAHLKHPIHGTFHHNVRAQVPSPHTHTQHLVQLGASITSIYSVCSQAIKHRELGAGRRGSRSEAREIPNTCASVLHSIYVPFLMSRRVSICLRNTRHPRAVTQHAQKHRAITMIVGPTNLHGSVTNCTADALSGSYKRQLHECNGRTF